MHTNIVVFGLRKSCPLSAKDFILFLQEQDVHVIPFKCAAPSKPVSLLLALASQVVCLPLTKALGWPLPKLLQWKHADTATVSTAVHRTAYV